MNVTDLPELMRERSAHDPAPPDGRMAAIGRKVTAGRWLRAAGVVAGVVLAVAAATVPAVAALRADHQRRPTPSASTIDGFAVYANGGRLVSESTQLYSGGGASLTVNADARGLIATNRCPVTSPDLEIDLQITINGRYHGIMSCGDGGTYATYPPALYPQWHVTPGQSVTFLFTPKAFRLTLGPGGQTTGRTPTALPAGSYSVAVYQQLAFKDYPLPSRPRSLPTLNIRQFGLADGATTVDSDPADPIAPKTLTLTLPAHCTPADCLDMAVTAQTPGEIDIRIDGTLVTTARFWDYDGSGSIVSIVETMQSMEPPYGDIHLTPGETITVTITPRYLTGAWEFAAAPPAN